MNDLRSKIIQSLESAGCLTTEQQTSECRRYANLDRLLRAASEETKNV
jgi:hypothetical protein